MAYVQPEQIIIRYGEIGLKQNITRRIFENTLIRNIKKSLQKQNIEFEIKRKRARIYISSIQIEDCIKILTKIFGITSLSPAFETNIDKKSLKKITLNIIENKITENTSFALKVNRTGNHDFTSRDIAIFLGDIIQKKTKAKVNLSNPDITLFVEIIDKKAFLFFEKISGAGGLPLSTQGRILAYIDSKEAILAAWFLMRRGCMPIFLIDNEALYDKVKNFTNNWHCNCYVEGNNKSIQEYAVQKRCDAIVTGYKARDFERIKQLEKKIKIPILHPLIGLNDEEIDEKIELIGL